MRRIITSLLLLSAAITDPRLCCALAADSAPDAQAAETAPAMAATRARLREMLGVDEVVFIKRFTYTSNHYYTEFINSQWLPGILQG